ncbi:MAG: adenylate/guanylate cyclase domain-containing protein [Proteobacteria bacterium]|nr:adenylate/guanylate cyclase domain-containing protein [Pseudomonadota bacterium]
MKRSWLLHSLAGVLTAVFLLLQLYDPAVLREYVESKTLDLRLYVSNIVKKTSPPQDILIVTIDEKSIAEVGRWPWKRNIMGDLVEKLSEGKPKAIGIDILFTESESEETDTAFAGSLAEAGKVVLASGFILNPEGMKTEKREVDYLWDHAFMKVKSTKELDWKQWVVKADSTLPPLVELADASSLGHVYIQSDRDGVLRWDILYIFYDEDFYPSLPLQMARIYLGLKMEDMSLLGGTGVRLGDRLIHTDLSGRVLINYLGRERTFKYISAADVLMGRVPPSTFEGKAVLIGTSAIALYDPVVSPLSANMSGVEKNATVIDNILRNSFIRRSPGIVEMAVTLLTALLPSLLLPRMSAIFGAVLAFSLVFTYVALSFYLFINQYIWLSLIYPVFNMLGIFTLQTTAKFFFEEKKARDIRNMFSSYVTERVVNELLKNPDMAGLGGHRREITVLFSDIRGFTSYSEKRDPEEVVSILNEYLTEMTKVIFRWDGTLDKFVGDEIMAFWGAPLEQEDHAERAVRCALDMMARLSELQEKWIAEGKEPLDIGIGVNTGDVLVGNIGAEGKKMDYTLIGDNVNLGARVEALTRDFKTHILITEFTYEKIKDHIIKEEDELVEGADRRGKIGHVKLFNIEEVKVKGKKHPVMIYELSARDFKNIVPL